MKKILHIAICFLFVIAPLSAEANDKLLDIQEVTSAGGIKAWLVEDHSLPIIAIKFAFKGAGSAQDPADKQGLARMASNTMDEGAGEYDSASFQKIMQNNNITITFGSGRDDFSGSIKLLSKDSELGFKLLRLAVNEPRFDQDPVDRMRAANIARIKSSMSSPDWKAARILNDVVYAGHPYALNSGGTLTTLAAITPEDLKNFAATRLAKDNLRIGVMGDITPEDLKILLDDVFGKLPEKAQLIEVPDQPLQNAGKTVLYEHDIPQTIIEIVQPGIDNKDPDYYTSMVMNFILGSSGFGSRLTTEIREKRGLTYGVHSYFHDLEHTEMMGVSTSTKNESVSEMLDLIKQEWNKMRDEPVSDDELKSAQSYLIGSFPLSLNSTDAIAGLLLGLQMDDRQIDYLDHRADRINAVTKEDIQTLTKRLLDTDAFTTILVGKPEGVTPTSTVDSLPNVE